MTVQQQSTVFFRRPLVKVNGAMENFVSLMMNKLQENRSKDTFNVYFKVLVFQNLRSESLGETENRRGLQIIYVLINKEKRIKKKSIVHY